MIIPNTKAGMDFKCTNVMKFGIIDADSRTGIIDYFSWKNRILAPEIE